MDTSIRAERSVSAVEWCTRWLDPGILAACTVRQQVKAVFESDPLPAPFTWPHGTPFGIFTWFRCIFIFYAYAFCYSWLQMKQRFAEKLVPYIFLHRTNLDKVVIWGSIMCVWDRESEKKVSYGVRDRKSDQETTKSATTKYNIILSISRSAPNISAAFWNFKLTFHYTYGYTWPKWGDRSNIDNTHHRWTSKQQQLSCVVKKAVWWYVWRRRLKPVQGQAVIRSLSDIKGAFLSSKVRPMNMFGSCSLLHSMFIWNVHGHHPWNTLNPDSNELKPSVRVIVVRLRSLSGLL